MREVDGVGLGFSNLIGNGADAGFGDMGFCVRLSRHGQSRGHAQKPPSGAGGEVRGHN